MMYAMRKDRIMGDTRRRSRAVMSGADRRSSQRSGQPRRRPAKKPDGRRQGQNAEAAIRPEKTTVRQHFCKWEAVCEWKTFTEGAFEKEGKERICILVSREKAVAILMGVLILLITATVAVVAAKWGKIGGVALNPDKLAISEEAEISGTGYLTVALFGLDTRETDERWDPEVIRLWWRL